MKQVREQARYRREAGPARAPSATAAAELARADAAAEFEEYRAEDAVYQAAFSKLRRALEMGYPVTIVERDFLPNFDFGRCVLVVVMGQDGLVANTAKYVGELPIVAINPDPMRYDGILLPFAPSDARGIIEDVLRNKAKTRNVTLAEVELNDGERMLAFNDLFIGAASHVSARYTLKAGRRVEAQSSSGLIVSTGAGSTGWMSSVFNMAEGVAKEAGAELPERPRISWEDRSLLWAVREPFRSRHSSASLVAGRVEEGQELEIESLMPSGGVIFSDGIESDRLVFGSGTIAFVRVSPRRARLVVK